MTNNHQHRPVIVHNFSLKFEQMCSMVAVGSITSADETLRELVQQCIVFLSNDKFSSADQFVEAFDILFGLDISINEVDYAIERLLATGLMRRTSEDIYVLPKEEENRIHTRIDEAHTLEETIQEQWQQELTEKFPQLEFNKVWDSLKNYLAKTFQRHGMQTVALLDPTIEVPIEYSESLSELLDDSVRSIPEDGRNDTKNAVIDFMTLVGTSPERASYIAQLADGAFNYFSLTISEDVSSQLRENLSPLVLFFDTNFLFGILDLDNGPQVGVSNDLLEVVDKLNFPFDLKYHQRTGDELIATVSHYENTLSQQNWSTTISRAASQSRYLSGVESRYHQRYSETGIDVGSFFAPYKHADELLRERSIDLFMPEEERLNQRTELINEYTEYLEKYHKTKTYKVIDHDMTVLDTVRQIRSSVKSTLHAGALFVTCDYWLYRFDWETAKEKGILPCIVLPNLFWQILRPFIPSDGDFSRSFAETFAIPEFRTIGSGATVAASKMLNLLAGYKDFPELTAKRMLSNDILINKLREAENDQQLQDYVEDAIVGENVDLLEERALLEEQLESERQEKTDYIEKLQQQQTVLAQKDNMIKSYEQKQSEDMLHFNEQSSETARERDLRINAEAQLAQIKERNQIIIKVIVALLLSAILILFFEFLIYQVPWNWLINHSDSYGIQASFGALVISFILGCFISKWRKWCWGVASLSFAVIILQILGGPN